MKQQGSKGIQFIEVTRNGDSYKLRVLGVFRIGVAPFQEAANRLKTDPQLYLKELVLDRTHNETPMLY